MQQEPFTPSEGNLKDDTGERFVFFGPVAGDADALASLRKLFRALEKRDRMRCVVSVLSAYEDRTKPNNFSVVVERMASLALLNSEADLRLEKLALGMPAHVTVDLIAISTDDYEDASQQSQQARQNFDFADVDDDEDDEEDVGFDFDEDDQLELSSDESVDDEVSISVLHIFLVHRTARDMRRRALMHVCISSGRSAHSCMLDAGSWKLVPQPSAATHCFHSGICMHSASLHGASQMDGPGYVDVDVTDSDDGASTINMQRGKQGGYAQAIPNPRARKSKLKRTSRNQ